MKRSSQTCPFLWRNFFAVRLAAAAAVWRLVLCRISTAQRERTAEVCGGVGPQGVYGTCSQCCWSRTQHVSSLKNVITESYFTLKWDFCPYLCSESILNIDTCRIQTCLLSFIASPDTQHLNKVIFDEVLSQLLCFHVRDITNVYLQGPKKGKVGHFQS